MPKETILKRILIWRAKYISHRQFVYLLSIIIGFTSGVGAVVLKNLTHFIQHLLEGNVVKYYHHAFYFYDRGHGGYRVSQWWHARNCRTHY